MRFAICSLFLMTLMVGCGGGSGAAVPPASEAPLPPEDKAMDAGLTPPPLAAPGKK